MDTGEIQRLRRKIAQLKLKVAQRDLRLCDAEDARRATVKRLGDEQETRLALQRRVNDTEARTRLMEELTQAARDAKAELDLTTEYLRRLTIIARKKYAEVDDEGPNWVDIAYDPIKWAEYCEQNLPGWPDEVKS